MAASWAYSAEKSQMEQKCVFEKWLLLNLLSFVRASCMFTNWKIKFSLKQTLFGIHRIERWREKSLRVKSFNNKKIKMKEDNGKSNFCITKHFTLFVLQAGNCVGGEGDVVLARGPSEWNLKYKRALRCFCMTQKQMPCNENNFFSSVNLNSWMKISTWDFCRLPVNGVVFVAFNIGSLYWYEFVLIRFSLQMWTPKNELGWLIPSVVVSKL